MGTVLARLSLAGTAQRREHMSQLQGVVLLLCRAKERGVTHVVAEATLPHRRVDVGHRAGRAVEAGAASKPLCACAEASGGKRGARAVVFSSPTCTGRCTGCSSCWSRHQNGPPDLENNNTTRTSRRAESLMGLGILKDDERQFAPLAGAGAGRGARHVSVVAARADRRCGRALRACARTAKPA